MLLGHEALQSFESLSQGPQLASGQSLCCQRSLEGSVVEMAARLLLLDPHLLQNSGHDVEVERHSSALERADGHEIEHSLGVQIALA